MLLHDDSQSGGSKLKGNRATVVWLTFPPSLCSSLLLPQCGVNSIPFGTSRYPSISAAFKFSPTLLSLPPYQPAYCPSFSRISIVSTSSFFTMSLSFSLVLVVSFLLAYLLFSLLISYKLLILFLCSCLLSLLSSLIFLSFFFFLPSSCSSSNF